ncbi:MAG: hypothetical protein HYX89_03340, partial [Chloroflexi bacterium]|nr:hypothetical protein [Chloroflexota bacterium]
LAHAAVLAMRWRFPEFHRPFKVAFNWRVRGHELPATAILGLLATASVWVVIVVAQSFSRWMGLGWMAAGIVLYIRYRRHLGLSLTKSTAKLESVG